MLKLYQFHPSGNCYKLRLLFAQLGVAYTPVEVDLPAGEAKTDAFRRMNPIGRVPTVELEPGVYLAESNAILWHFGEGTPLVPSDRLARSRMLQWMFFEQYSHEPYVAVARAWLSYFGIPEGKEAELVERQRRGVEALAVMESELRQRPFFAGERYSLADIALYAYTHVAGEGAIDLQPFPAIGEWLARVAAQPGHVPLGATPHRGPFRVARL